MLVTDFHLAAFAVDCVNCVQTYDPAFDLCAIDLVF